MIKFQDSQALTLHFERFWSIVQGLYAMEIKRSKKRYGRKARKDLFICFDNNQLRASYTAQQKSVTTL